MRTQLFNHNKIAYQKVMRTFETADRTCVVHPTGTGKSYLIAAVSNLLLMTFIGLQLWSFRADLRRKLARFREDESDHQRNMIERGIGEAKQRFFSKFRRE